MHYFGESWGAAVCNHAPRAKTPTGEHCAWCGEVFVEGDQGVIIPGLAGAGPPYQACLISWHKDCFLRSVVGSIGHQTRQCSCFGGGLDDPPGLSRRAAASAAAAYFDGRQKGEAI